MSAREAGRAADRERIDAIRAYVERSPSPDVAESLALSLRSDVAWLLSRVDELEADRKALAMRPDVPGELTFYQQMAFELNDGILNREPVSVNQVRHMWRVFFSWLPAAAREAKP